MVDKFFLKEAELENALHDKDLDLSRQKIIEICEIALSNEYSFATREIFRKRIFELEQDFNILENDNQK